MALELVEKKNQKKEERKKELIIMIDEFRKMLDDDQVDSFLILYDNPTGGGYVTGRMTIENIFLSCSKVAQLALDDLVDNDEYTLRDPINEDEPEE